MTKQPSIELLSILNDHVFRRIFGQLSVDSLADFLSVVLDIPLDELTELQVEDPNLYRDSKDGKVGELDVRVRTKNKEIVHVEIQLNPVDAFGSRIAFYNARIFSRQLKKGEDYAELKRTISVVIVNYNLFPEYSDCVNRFRWYNINNGALLTDAQEINTIDLTKLPKSDDGVKLWKWLRFLTLQKEDEMDELAGDNSAMKNVIVHLREMSADETERRLAEEAEKQRRDMVASRMYGEKIGEARGLEQGATIRSIEIARNMKADGDPIEKIARNTGLSEDVIVAL